MYQRNRLHIKSMVILQWDARRNEVLLNLFSKSLVCESKTSHFPCQTFNVRITIEHKVQKFNLTRCNYHTRTKSKNWAWCGKICTGRFTAPSNNVSLQLSTHNLQVRYYGNTNPGMLNVSKVDLIYQSHESPSEDLSRASKFRVKSYAPGT